MSVNSHVSNQDASSHPRLSEPQEPKAKWEAMGRSPRSKRNEKHTHTHTHTQTHTHTYTHKEQFGKKEYDFEQALPNHVGDAKLRVNQIV